MDHKRPILYIDTRESSHTHSTGPLAGRKVGIDLLPIFQSHRESPTVLPRTLSAGDICFTGNGPKGPCLIGIERKRLKDMMRSIRTGRYSGEQIPKLLDHYDITYLILEGCWRSNRKTGILEERWNRTWSPLLLGSSSFVALELLAFLDDIRDKTPIRVVTTHDEYTTCEFVMSLSYSWSKPWERRHAHIGLHVPDPAQLVTIGKASTLRRVANQLHGVGWERSRAVEEAFSSVLDMAQAPVVQWAKIDGFGKVLSNRVYNDLRGINEE